MTKVQAMSDTPPWSGQGPQKPKADRAAPSSTEGYVRVELHSANGQLSVVGASEVPGPLTIPSAVINGLAYEVLLDDQQIALGSIPDVGLRREGSRIGRESSEADDRAAQRATRSRPPCPCDRTAEAVRHRDH
jgi:hypothetical protein